MLGNRFLSATESWTLAFEHRRHGQPTLETPGLLACFLRFTFAFRDEVVDIKSTTSPELCSRTTM